MARTSSSVYDDQLYDWDAASASCVRSTADGDLNELFIVQVHELLIVQVQAAEQP